ncbi:MAG: thioether cross-link-forming SCIFF peptide maturase [Oscillospiraceae bacterium]|nr:thioether cross-link-forming SCIFF peptide maturase [Oscillospiraceae bacterium]
MQKPFHKFFQGGNYILLDVCNGGVHVVEEDIYYALDSENYEDTPEYAELCEAGLFGGADDYENYADVNVGAPLKAMCLHVSHDCDLRCKYCFADDVIIQRDIMSPETAKKAVDFLIRGSAGAETLNSKSREHLEIDFFGGEPLLAWETITAAVSYSKQEGAKFGKKFKFTLTTNGILLDDEKIAYINEEMSNVVLSLDGRKEVNDKMRGKGVFDAVLPKFKKLVDSRKKQDFTDYFIRGTYTSYNLDFADDVLAIANEGFKYISIEPVTVAADLPFALLPEHLPRIKNEYDRLFEICRGAHCAPDDWTFFHFHIDLHNSPCILKRLRGCGAGNEYIAVTPDGNIFPCHRYAGIDEWKMGNININNTDEKIKQYFAKTHIYVKEKCRSCWARFYCGGGCNAEFYLFEGDARKPQEVFCEWMKKRIECAIALAIHNA